MYSVTSFRLPPPPQTQTAWSACWTSRAPSSTRSIRKGRLTLAEPSRLAPEADSKDASITRYSVRSFDDA